MKIKEATGETLVEKALNEGADAGVRLADLPSPSGVSWRGVIRPEAVFDKEDLARIAAYRTEAGQLREEIDAHSHEQVVKQFYTDMRSAVSDAAARQALETKADMTARARLIRRSAKQRLGEVEAELARNLVGAGQRCLKACDWELDKLQSAEAKLCATYNAPAHLSPLQWSLRGSLRQLREAVARGFVPLATLERICGPAPEK